MGEQISKINKMEQWIDESPKHGEWKKPGMKYITNDLIYM